MEIKKFTRKDFLTNTSKFAVGAVAGVAGLNMLTSSKAFAKTNNAVWPMPYATIDPEVARIKAHTLFYEDKDCCAGTFGAFTDLLSEAGLEAWQNIPKEIMLYGRGGGVGWGVTCGTINGGAAVISAVVPKADSGKLINELWGWYTTSSLPSDQANSVVYENDTYRDSLPQNVSGSPLCHSSVSQWCNVANKPAASVERKERCARLAGDTAAKVAEILNDYFASTFVYTFAPPANNDICMPCHSSGQQYTQGATPANAFTHMECVTCHPDAHYAGGVSAVEQVGETPAKFKLNNNYPNPFNPSTTIQFALPESGKVRLEVYNIQGRLVNSIIDSEFKNAGSYKATWDGTDNTGSRVASGIYFARLTSANHMQTIKMNLLK